MCIVYEFAVDSIAMKNLEIAFGVEENIAKMNTKRLAYTFCVLQKKKFYRSSTYGIRVKNLLVILNVIPFKCVATFNSGICFCRAYFDSINTGHSHSTLEVV